MRRSSLRRFVSVVAAAALLIGNTVALAHAAMLMPSVPLVVDDGAKASAAMDHGQQAAMVMDNGNVRVVAAGNVQSPEICDDSDCAPTAAAVCVLNAGCMSTCALGSGTLLCDTIGVSGPPPATVAPRSDTPLLVRATLPELGPPRL